MRLQPSVKRPDAVVILIVGAALSSPVLTAPLQPAAGQGEVPTRVMDTLKARFPKAEIRKWTREDEDGIVIYDFEFTQDGHKFEADIKADGTIHNWERGIAITDLPAAVRNAVDQKYPGWEAREIMETTAVTDGQEKLEEYEIVLVTADKRELEVTLAPDGRILEESPVEK